MSHLHILHLLFFAVMVVLISIGLLCAARLDHRNPFWVRMVVLSPCMVALVTTFRMVKGDYVPYPEDVMFYVALALNYALIYSRFTGRAWLDLRTAHWIREQQQLQQGKS